MLRCGAPACLVIVPNAQRCANDVGGLFHGSCSLLLFMPYRSYFCRPSIRRIATIHRRRALRLYFLLSASGVPGSLLLCCPRWGLRAACAYFTFPYSFMGFRRSARGTAGCFRRPHFLQHNVHHFSSFVHPSAFWNLRHLDDAVGNSSRRCPTFSISQKGFIASATAEQGA